MICSIDEQPLRSVVPPSPAPPPPPAPERREQDIVDREHLNLLSIFHFVIAGLALFGVAFLFLHYAIMSTVFSNPNIWKGPNSTPPPPQLMQVFVWFYLFAGAFLVTAFVLNLLSALFLRHRTHRVFSLVVGGLNCLQIPFGTVLGIFTIIVLGRDSVCRMYDADEERLRAAH